jgi:hypothetical protein
MNIFLDDTIVRLDDRWSELVIENMIVYTEEGDWTNGDIHLVNWVQGCFNLTIMSEVIR